MNCVPEAKFLLVIEGDITGDHAGKAPGSKYPPFCLLCNTVIKCHFLPINC